MLVHRVGGRLCLVTQTSLSLFWCCPFLMLTESTKGTGDGGVAGGCDSVLTCSKKPANLPQCNRGRSHLDARSVNTVWSGGNYSYQLTTDPLMGGGRLERCRWVQFNTKAAAAATPVPHWQAGGSDVCFLFFRFWKLPFFHCFLNYFFLMALGSQWVRRPRGLWVCGMQWSPPIPKLLHQSYLARLQF